MKEYRTGGLGAMMDEYERVTDELLAVLSRVDTQRFEQIIDPAAPDHARSIQAIMSHVVRAGYNYANYIRKIWDIPVANPEVTGESHDTAMASVKKMLAYTSETLE